MRTVIQNFKNIAGCKPNFFLFEVIILIKVALPLKTQAGF